MTIYVIKPSTTKSKEVSIGSEKYVQLITGIGKFSIKMEQDKVIVTREDDDGWNHFMFLYEPKQITAYYMWGMKPGDTSEIPTDIIRKNDLLGITPLVSSKKDIERLLPMYPELHKIWDLIPHWITKADIGRLLLVHQFGNYYFDVDCEVLESLPGDFTGVVLFIENIVSDLDQLGPREQKIPLRIANYAFGAGNSHHPFLSEVINESIRRIKKLLAIKDYLWTESDILWIGPDTITTVFHAHNWTDVYLFPKIANNQGFGSWRD